MNKNTIVYMVTGTVAILVIVAAMFAMGGADYFNRVLGPMVDTVRPWLGFPEVAVEEGVDPYAPNTEHGDAIDAMIIYIHLMMAVLFVGWTGYFFVSMSRFRKSKNPVADHSGVTSKVPTTLVEYGVIVAEVILIALFAVPLWGRVVDADKFPSAGLRDGIEKAKAWTSSLAGAGGEMDIKLSGEKLADLDARAAGANGVLDLDTTVTLHAPENGTDTALYVINLTSDEHTQLTIKWIENGSDKTATVDNAKIFDGLFGAIDKLDQEIKTGDKPNLEQAETNVARKKDQLNSETNESERKKFEMELEAAEKEEKKLRGRIEDKEQRIAQLKKSITPEKLKYAAMVEIKSGAECTMTVRRGSLSSPVPRAALERQRIAISEKIKAAGESTGAGEFWMNMHGDVETLLSENESVEDAVEAVENRIAEAGEIKLPEANGVFLEGLTLAVKEFKRASEEDAKYRLYSTRCRRRLAGEDHDKVTNHLEDLEYDAEDEDIEEADREKKKQELRNEKERLKRVTDPHRILATDVSVMPTVVIRIISEQFEWNGLYAGYDGTFGKQDMQLATSENKFGFVAGDANGLDDFVANEVVVPEGVPVINHITSKDVIHCFKIIPMRICQDAIPGLKIPVHYKAKAPLRSWINCAQLCGNGHAYMKGDFEVKTRGGFAAWWNEHAGWWNRAQ